MTPVVSASVSSVRLRDPHEHLGVGMTPAHLQITAEAGGEPRADRLDDRVHEVRLAELPQVRDGRVEAVEVVGRVRDQHRGRAQPVRDVTVAAVEAEDVVHASGVGHQDLVGVERVDAEREPARLQVGDRLRPLVEPVRLERQPEVDDVGAGVAVVARRRDDLLAVEPLHAVDLGEHADVAPAVARARVGLAEERRQSLEVGGALLGGEAELLREDLGVALAATRDHDPRDVRRDLEPAGDPARRHQRRDRDLHHRDVVVERQLGAPQRLAQRGLRELAGHEQVAIGHPGPLGVR